MKTENEHRIAMKAIVEAELFTLVPTLLEAERAKDEFCNAPSLKSGVRRYDAEVAAHRAIDKAATNIWAKWNASHKEWIEIDEVQDYIHDAMETQAKDEGEYWIGEIGKRLEVK
jgi:hypothetical protein